MNEMIRQEIEKYLAQLRGFGLEIGNPVNHSAASRGKVGRQLEIF